MIASDRRRLGSGQGRVAPARVGAARAWRDGWGLGGDEADANHKWAIAVDGRASTQLGLIESVSNPDPRWTSSHITAADVSCALSRSQTVPLDIAIDATIAKRVSASGSKATRAKWRAHAEGTPSLCGARRRRGRAPSGLRSRDELANAESVGLARQILAGKKHPIKLLHGPRADPLVRALSVWQLSLARYRLTSVVIVYATASLTEFAR